MWGSPGWPQTLISLMVDFLPPSAGLTGESRQASSLTCLTIDLVLGEKYPIYLLQPLQHVQYVCSESPLSFSLSLSFSVIAPTHYSSGPPTAARAPLRVGDSRLGCVHTLPLFRALAWAWGPSHSSTPRQPAAAPPPLLSWGHSW